MLLAVFLFFLFVMWTTEDRSFSAPSGNLSYMSCKFQPAEIYKIQLFLEDPPKNWTCQLSSEGSTRRSGILPVHTFIAPVHLHLSSQKRGHRHHSILGNTQHVILTWSEWSVYDKDHIHCIHIYNVILTRRKRLCDISGFHLFCQVQRLYEDCRQHFQQSSGISFAEPVIL